MLDCFDCKSSLNKILLNHIDISKCKDPFCYTCGRATQPVYWTSKRIRLPSKKDYSQYLILTFLYNFAATPPPPPPLPFVLFFCFFFFFFFSFFFFSLFLNNSLFCCYFLIASRLFLFYSCFRRRPFCPSPGHYLDRILLCLSCRCGDGFCSVFLFMY